MRPHQIFAEMTPDKCEQVMGRISEEAPEVFRQTVTTAATALKFRPQYLLKQPIPKRVASVRRVLARSASDPLAEELLAIYFLKCRLELLTEWLDLVGLAHQAVAIHDHGHGFSGRKRAGRHAGDEWNVVHALHVGCATGVAH